MIRNQVEAFLGQDALGEKEFYNSLKDPGFSYNAFHGRIWRMKKKHDIETKPAPVFQPPVLDWRTIPRPSRMWNPQACVFDIERSIESDDFQGTLLCACVLPLTSNEPPRVFELEYSDSLNDERLVRDLIICLADFDFIVGHSVKSADLGWVNSARMLYRMPPMRAAYVFDTYVTAQNGAVKSRKGLGPLGEFFHAETKKPPVSSGIWADIKRGKESFTSAMKVLTHRCVSDCYLTAELADIFWEEGLNLRRPQLSITKW